MQHVVQMYLVLTGTVKVYNNEKVMSVFWYYNVLNSLIACQGR